MAVPGPFDDALTYSLPDELGSVRRGQAVLVPLGGRRVTGWVVALDPPEPEGFSIKPVAGLLEEEPIVTEEQLGLFERVANYYLHPIGEVLRTALPGAERSETRLRVVRTELEPPEGLGEEARHVLELAAGKGQRREALLKRLKADGQKGGPALLRELVEQGLLEERQIEDRSRRARAMERWVGLKASLSETLDSFERAGAVRDRLVLHLHRRGMVRRTELTDQFPGAARILAELDRRALLTEELREPHAEQVRSPPVAPPELTDEQRVAVESVEPALDEQRFEVNALVGVTGSGKTEVYLRLAERALAAGRGVLILVPEISLTPQLEERVASRLGEVALLHSGLTPVERHEAWWALRRSRTRVALGVRSAVFAPVPDLGLIVVDEEHDGSYKQDDGLRYNARDVAVLRAHGLGIPCVLGSATPSLETLGNIEQGRYRRLNLTRRVEGRPLPTVERVDLGGVSVKDNEVGRWLTDPLLEALGQTLDDGEQSLLLLNRRGFATFVVCASCGVPAVCSDCDTSMVHHARSQRLRCHLCGWSVPHPERCPGCGSEDILLAGRGTERIEDEVAARFPGARVDRLDRDTTRRRGSLAEILDRFRRREVDVLVGTQMLAKGHDLPGVTLVGVIHADSGLGLPDFRAAERTFQLLTQVAGRAGRGDRPGRVLFQALRPEHPVLKAAADQDLEAFLAYERRRRELGGWPPDGHLAILRMDARDRGVLQRRGQELARQFGADAPVGSRVLGPVQPLVPMVRGRHHLQLLLRSPDRTSLRRWLLANPVWRAQGQRGVRVQLDIDPLRLA